MTHYVVKMIHVVNGLDCKIIIMRLFYIANDFSVMDRFKSLFNSKIQIVAFRTLHFLIYIILYVIPRDIFSGQAAGTGPVQQIPGCSDQPRCMCEY